MRRKREYLDYLQDILDAARKAQQFVAGMDLSQFVADDKTNFAVVRALEIIGEAAKRVPSSMRTRYAHLPWREMAGIRDKLIHEYFGVDLRVVWQTLQDDLPFISEAIAQIMEEIGSEG